MSKYAFGVDVGGTTVKLGLFNDEGQVLDKWEIPTVKDNGGEKVLPDIAASIKNKMQEKNISVEELVGVGIGAPGAVDADGYMVNGAVNIGWGAFDLAETLKKEALVEAKDDAYKIRNEAEQEARERRAEVQNTEKRLMQKEDILDRKSDSLEQKEEKLLEREQSLLDSKNDVDRLIEEQKAELERIAGLTNDEAKNQLFRQVEAEIDHDLAVMINQNMG